MDINAITHQLHDRARTSFDVYERRPGKYQLINPIRHEDGDMVDIYLTVCPEADNRIRICDFGMALMRLSTTYDLKPAARQKIFDEILANNEVRNDEGNLYLDTTAEMLYESILQFAGCVQKVCNMRYWNRETIRSAFYEDLKNYTRTELRPFNPLPDYCPLPKENILTVDWALTYNHRNLYLFGVHNNDKAKNVIITLLEFQKTKLPFISLIVYENMEEVARKERRYLTKNADTQYPSLADYRDKTPADIKRLAAA